jgi:capsular polysaccharide transport system permease protein
MAPIQANSTAPAGSTGLRLRFGVMLALMLHDIKIRFRISAMGYFLVLAEPVAQFFVMFLIFHAIQRQPDFGISLGVFLATGIVPFFLFMHLSSRIISAIRSGRSFNKVQTVGFLDLAVARAVLEFLTLVIFGTAVFAVLAFFGEPAIPQNLLDVIYTVVILAITAFGFGLINGVLTKIFKVYALIYSLFARGMLFFSGVFYVVATLPPLARHYLSYNPLLHGIEWFRLGFFESYPAIDLDRGYLGAWAVGTVTLGLVMIKACESRLKE